ncbi:MAG: glycosyltransferase family 2 protein [Pyrinomonadaceae bacterium]
MKISAVIITFNEEKNIRRAIESANWADEVLVVDSESTDKTRQIAESLGARVVVHPWEGFSKQKQFAVDRASFEWILSLDADEEVSPDLKKEIQNLKKSPEELSDGYRIPRLSFYMNRPIRHSGWYPDRQLRLFNRKKGKWNEVLIHESFQLEKSARTGNLRGDIFHFSVENAAHHHKMIGERYAPLSARQMFENGRTTSKLNILSAGPLAFFRSFILKGGFLDGFPGFVIARFGAHHAFLKHLLLWEMAKKNKSKLPE